MSIVFNHTSIIKNSHDVAYDDKYVYLPGENENKWKKKRVVFLFEIVKKD